MSSNLPPDAFETPDDAMLSAWLDGELDPIAHANVAAWLRRNPHEAARVRQWRHDRDDLHAHFAPVVDEPVPPALLATLQRAPAQQPLWRRAAMVAGLLITGAAAGGLAGVSWVSQHPDNVAALPSALRGASPVQPTSWTHRAAVAHAVYVPEVKHPVEVSVTQGTEAEQRAQEEHLARWLTKRLDMPVRLFDLHSQGFELVGGRLLPDAAGPSAQLMYQDSAGQRVTLYLRKPEPGATAAFRFQREGELGMFYWMEDGFGYALVGKLPREQLLAVAQAVYGQSGMSPAPAKTP